MKKTKLIKLLQDIPGNPDILLWNGYVQDWVGIDPAVIKGYLVKKTLEYYSESVRIEECIDRKDWKHQLSEDTKIELAKYHRTFPWEYNEWVTQDSIDANHYKGKRVYFLQNKRRGIKTFDRGGGIEY